MLAIWDVEVQHLTEVISYFILTSHLIKIDYSQLAQGGNFFCQISLNTKDRVTV